MVADVRERLKRLKKEKDVFNDDFLQRVKNLYNECKELELKREECEAATELAYIHLARGHFFKALNYLSEADDLSDYLNDFYLKAIIYGAFAAVYENQQLSLYALYYRLEVDSILNNNLLTEEQEYFLHKNYNNIGISYLTLGMYEKSESYLIRALKAKKYDDFNPHVNISMLCNLVILYSRTSAFEQARKRLDEIKVIKDKEEDDFLNYLYKLAKAEYEYYIGNVIEAHFLYNDCLEYSIKNFDTFEDVDLISSWVTMLREHKMCNELEHLNELIKKHSSEYVFDFKLLIVENEYLIAKYQDNLDKALRMHEKLYELRNLKNEKQQKLIYQNLDRIVNISKNYNSEKRNIYRDELTNCYNRKFLRKYFEKINRSNNINKEITFIIMDVDNFKEYNDFYGHVRGDLVIKEVSAILNDIAKLNDSYAVRYGGDEFLIISPNKSSYEGLSIAMEIKKRLNEKSILHEKSNVASNVTVTTGVSSFDASDKLDLSKCVANADIQLYKGKEAGRNCIFHLDNMIC
jgi:diguanylate cyclase (GGDEF)-like protein